jgi:hypothetical protein
MPNVLPSTMSHEPSAISHDAVFDAAERLDAWIERQGFKGWDPHDALNSPLIKALTFGNRWLGVAWLQAFKRSPVNLRRIVGVPKGHNPKGMGLFLASYLRKYRCTQKPADLERVTMLAQWLDEAKRPGYHGACWGYNFDWPTRRSFTPAGTPTIVNTSFNGLALLDCSIVADDQDRSPLAARGLTLARSACDFLLRDLNSERPASDELCFSYTPLDRRFIHNANVLAASLLAAVSVATGESDLAEAALAAARHTARRQRVQGWWPYGEEAGDEWVDNFHTGYVLVALKRVAACLHTSEFNAAIMRGYDFWKRRMFLEDGTPKYYVDRTYPIDTHCVAQAILTFLAFTDADPDASTSAWAMARYAVDRLQDPAGFFHYQIQPKFRIRIPYMRWTQAWIQRAFAELLWTDARSPVS